jgi:hypothetical protein
VIDLLSAGKLAGMRACGRKNSVAPDLSPIINLINII